MVGDGGEGWIMEEDWDTGSMLVIRENVGEFGNVVLFKGLD